MKTKNKQMLHRLRVSKILRTKYKTHLVSIDSIGDSLLTFPEEIKSAQGFSTEGTLSFDRDVIKSMGERPSQKSLTRNNCCPRQIFNIVRDGKLLILYFESKENGGQCMWCKICGMCANIELTLQRAMWILQRVLLVSRKCCSSILIPNKEELGG